MTSPASPSTPLLAVDALSVSFRTRSGPVQAVHDVSLTVRRGQTLGIVGESGSGKSVTSYAVMGILDRAGRIDSGSIRYGGFALETASETVMNSLRGREISMIFQNPRAALNPIRTVGDQIADVLIEHAQATHQSAREKAIEALRRVRIRDPEQRVDSYPFELSGGMCQRLMIAMALACRPQLLIADEPTTGLDVTTQRAVMDLVRDLTRSEQMATVLITHDLGLAGEYCDDIIVMQRGRVVESGPARTLFTLPRHPYTQGLVRATPHRARTVRDLLPLGAARESTEPVQSATTGRPLLDVVELRKEFPRPRSLANWLRREKPQPFEAVKGITFQVGAGESVGLVGESGCGKSTTSAMIMRLIEPTSGSIRFKGHDIALLRPEVFAQSPARAKMQMVFQDPTDSLDPRWSAARSIADPLVGLGIASNRSEIDGRVERLAQQVGLPLDLLDRLPHQLSGGQKARVGIARALACEPELVVLDEPTAALDVSVQALVLNLLADLRASLGMAYLFVSHDLEVVRLLCDRVLVMRAGEIVESGETRQVLLEPRHEYTRALLAAAPRPPSSAPARPRTHATDAPEIVS